MRSRTKDGRVRIEVRLPPRMADRIRRAAAAERLSYNAVIVGLLERAIRTKPAGAVESESAARS